MYVKFSTIMGTCCEEIMLNNTVCKNQLFLISEIVSFILQTYIQLFERESFDDNFNICI